MHFSFHVCQDFDQCRICFLFDDAGRSTFSQHLSTHCEGDFSVKFALCGRNPISAKKMKGMHESSPLETWVLKAKPDMDRDSELRQISFASSGLYRGSRPINLMESSPAWTVQGICARNSARAKLSPQMNSFSIFFGFPNATGESMWYESCFKDSGNVSWNNCRWPIANSRWLRFVVVLMWSSEVSSGMSIPRVRNETITRNGKDSDFLMIYYI